MYYNYNIIIIILYNYIRITRPHCWTISSMEILETILLLAFPADIGSKSSSPARPTRGSHNAYTPARVGFAGKPTRRLMMQPTVETRRRPYGA